MNRFDAAKGPPTHRRAADASGTRQGGRVALVNMPFSGTNRPALGLSLLKAALSARGIGSEVVYLNLRYEALVGVNAYRLVEGSPSSLLLGEWIFAEALWGRNADRDECYLRMLLDGVRSGTSVLNEGFSIEEIARVVGEARECAEGFINHCLDEVPWDEFRVVGFSSTFQQHVPSLALAKRLKARQPHLYCAFGGANCEGEMGDVLFEAFPFIDAVCTGEGDLVFPELVAMVLGEAPARPLSGMRQRETGPLGVVAEPGRAVAMGALPIPDFDDFFFRKRAAGQGGCESLVIPFETSRGCWWGQKHHCTFCGLNGSSMAFREKSSAQSIGEITALGARYGAFTHDFEAADNILPMSYFKSFFPELARLDLGYQFFYETKSNIRPDQVSILSRAGVNVIQPGIESLCTPVLRLMDKGVKAIENLRLLTSCAQHGVRPFWNYLVGFPGETEEDYAGQTDLFQSISHLQPPSTGGAGRVRFDRFSPYTTRPGGLGVSALTPSPAYRLVYDGLTAAQLDRLAYFFDGRFAGDAAVPERLERISEGLREWTSAYAGSALFSVEVEGALVVFDFRPISRHPHTVLREPWRSLYLGCASILGREALRGRYDDLCQDDDPSADLFARGLTTLLDRRLLFRENDQYLALALSLSLDGGFQLSAGSARRYLDLVPGLPGLLAGAEPRGLLGQPMLSI